MKKQYIIPIFVPHLGCPNDCIFCNQKSISGQKDNMTKEKAKKIIEDYLKMIDTSESIVEIAFFGGSFTAIPEEQQNELLELANKYVEEGKIESIRISTRPDAIDKKILQRLKKYKVKTIELGVQSANDYILQRANRGHTYKDVKKASKLIRRYGFNLGHQMMVGLPDSSREDDINTAKQLIKLKPKMVRIYPVLVVKNTKLAEEYEKGTYQPIPLPQAIETCKQLVRMFDNKKIEIIRVGLQNTDEIDNPKSEKSEVIAGPFHPAFRQLVESSMWYDAIIEKIKKLNVQVKEVEITANPIDVNNIIGHKKENILKLKETYDVDLVIEQSEKIKQGKMQIKILKTYEDSLKENKVPIEK